METIPLRGAYVQNGGGRKKQRAFATECRTEVTENVVNKHKMFRDFRAKFRGLFPPAWS